MCRLVFEFGESRGAIIVTIPCCRERYCREGTSELLNQPPPVVAGKQVATKSNSQKRTTWRTWVAS